MLLEKQPKMPSSDDVVRGPEIALPRVTEIIRAAGLVNGIGFNAEAARFGTVVHALALHMPWDGDMSGVDMIAAHERAEGYTFWLKRLGASVVEVEVEMWDEDRGYAGRCDAIMNIRQRDRGASTKTWIADLKSGAAQPWHGIQLAAYASLYARLHNMATPLLLKRGAIYLSKEKAPQLREYEDRSDFSRFAAALTLYKTRREWNLI